MLSFSLGNSHYRLIVSINRRSYLKPSIILNIFHFYDRKIRSINGRLLIGSFYFLVQELKIEIK